jgi:hypothetical protein
LALGDLVQVRVDGTVDPSFAPRPGPDPTNPQIVRALAVANGVLYVGGQFTTIGGQARASLAALDPVTGAVESWNPALGLDPNFGSVEVDVVAVTGGTVYVGGRFDSAAGVPDVAVGGFAAASGQLVWSPQTGWGGGTLVDALALDGGTVYAAAGVSGVQPQSVVDAFAISDASLRWQAVTFAGTLALAGGRLYASGATLYALDPATGTQIAWDPKPTA